MTSEVAGAVRVTVDPRACQGHGECTRIAPDVFVLDDTLTARCDEKQPMSRWDDLEHAQSGCPAQAIHVEPLHD